MIEIAKLTTTVVREAIANGERLHATETLNFTPTIEYFFASAPTPAQAQNKIRHILNWTTQNANRVEIIGLVMGNPAKGSWPIYDESDDWVVWEANNRVRIEQTLFVPSDSDTSNVLQNVVVDGRAITFTIRDPQFVDVNDRRVINRYVIGGSTATFPIQLEAGRNIFTVGAQSVGVTPHPVVELSLGNLISGSAVKIAAG